MVIFDYFETYNYIMSYISKTKNDIGKRIRNFCDNYVGSVV